MDFVDPLEPRPRYVCGLCELVARSPMQTDCGHIFCNDCLQEAMSIAGKRCYVRLMEKKYHRCFQIMHAKERYRGWRLDVDMLKTMAVLNWTGTLSTKDVHYITCEYRDEQCPECGNYMIWTKLKKHVELECPMRVTVCRYCSESIPVSHEKLHIQEECPEVKMQCPNNCNPNCVMKRKELIKHLSAEDGDCPFSVVDCPYKPLGCTFTGVRVLLVKHLQENEIYHQQLLVKRVGNLEKDHAKRITDLEERTSKFQSQTIASGTQSMPTATPSRGIDAAVLPTVSSDDGQLLRRVPELFTKQEEMSKAIEKLMISSVDHELRVQLLEQATHNGVLVWKIDEVTRKMDEAVKGITVSLFSAPFYSDPRGYKMCARCYLNGDGMGKGTHFSLFFIVMRGLYDALLRWPFRQRVTMTLLNQSGGRHALDSFRPDSQSPSYQQPMDSDMNIASGYPRFIPLEEFIHGGFIKEDCIFVKVVVDLDGAHTLM